jgi:hypothetical protein
VLASYPGVYIHEVSSGEPSYAIQQFFLDGRSQACAVRTSPNNPATPADIAMQDHVGGGVALTATAKDPEADRYRGGHRERSKTDRGHQEVSKPGGEHAEPGKTTSKHVDDANGVFHGDIRCYDQIRIEAVRPRNQPPHGLTRKAEAEPAEVEAEEQRA